MSADINRLSDNKEISPVDLFYESFEKLNEYQKAAVLDYRKALLVNAHVGSGKTTVLIHKILYLHFIKKLPLQSMVVLTFTNKAAQEIKDRLKQLGSTIKNDDMKFFGTFHSVCRTLLSSSLTVENLGYTKEFSIADGDEILELYDRIMIDNNLSIKYKNKIKKRMDKVKSGETLYGNMKNDDDINELMKLLKQEKIRCNIMDFDDLIDYSIELLPISQFKPQWIIIDEFQDCDSRQLKMVELLAGNTGNIFAVGDPNQVIYSWRGGGGEVFEDFKVKHNASEISLPINYRSTTTILNAARSFLKNGVNLSGVRESGTPITIKKHHNRFNEAVYLCQRIKSLNSMGTAYKDIAVFYRKQKDSEVFAEVFDKHDIPFEVSSRKTLRDTPALYWALRLLKAAVNNRDKSSIVFLLGTGRYGVGISQKKVKDIAQKFFKADADTCGIELLSKIKGFREWCGNHTTSLEETASQIYDYFDIAMYLAPTSITFEEDRRIVMKLLNDITEYSVANNKDIFEVIGDYANSSSLYGNQILKEVSNNIHQDEDTVKLMTLHASKGLEFDYVFISGVNLGNIPIISKGEEGEKEEQRLFFVGITRARDSLEISYHVKPDDFGVYGVPSPYLRMIPEELIESEDFGSRASSLGQLRREIKDNIDKKSESSKANCPADNVKHKVLVVHDKYGQGEVISEDENNITVEFPVYGDKTFTKMFCPLKYI